MEEQTERRPSRIAQILKVLSDHADLASVEAQFEAEQASKRVLGIFLAAVFGLAAFTFLQFAVVAGLVALGLHFGYACLLLSVLYALAGGCCFFRLGRRDPKAGRAFDGTRRELGETLEWIQKLFS